jgi:hypothetical protein
VYGSRSFAGSVIPLTAQAICLSTQFSVDSTLIDSKKVENFQVTTVIRRKSVKVHASVSSEGLPLSLLLSPGNEHGSKRFVEVPTEIRIGKGIDRPRSRPMEVLADAAYDDKDIRCTSKVEI